MRVFHTLALELVSGICVSAAGMTVEEEDESDAEGGFCGCDGDDEENEEGCCGVFCKGGESPKSEEVEVGSAEHELDASEDEDGVFAREGEAESEGKEQGTEKEVKLERHWGLGLRSFFVEGEDGCADEGSG